MLLGLQQEKTKNTVIRSHQSHTPLLDLPHSSSFYHMHHHVCRGIRRSTNTRNLVFIYHVTRFHVLIASTLASQVFHSHPCTGLWIWRHPPKLAFMRTRHINPRQRHRHSRQMPCQRHQGLPKSVSWFLNRPMTSTWHITCWLIIDFNFSTIEQKLKFPKWLILLNFSSRFWF